MGGVEEVEGRLEQEKVVKERSMKKGAEMTRRMEDEEAKTQKGQ